MGNQLLAWASTSIHVLLCVGLLVVALVRTRRASAAGAYLIAAGAAVQILSSCCVRGLSAYRHHQIDVEGYSSGDTLVYASQTAGLLANVIVVGLLIAGFAVTARALRPSTVRVG